jgi:hypothetical protein
MDTKQALEEKRPESVRFLEKLRFRWVNQGQHSNNWHGSVATLKTITEETPERNGVAAS